MCILSGAYALYVNEGKVEQAGHFQLSKNEEHRKRKEEPEKLGKKVSTEIRMRLNQGP